MKNDEALRSIEKLHEMKQAGIISEADFEQSKKDLLAGLGRQKARPAALATAAPPPELPTDEDHFAWMVLPLRRYTDFQGRSCRKEYWMFQIVVVLLVFVCVTAAVDGILIISATTLLALAGLAVPAVALQVRRFHDMDQTGWFALLNLVPYLGPLIIMGFMLIDGTPGENQYGPDPKGR